MKIKIIGADAAFDGLNTSFYFRDDSGRGVLVDCGFTVFPELNRLGMLNDIDVCLISHPHADHTGSLTKLAAWNSIMKQQKLIVGGHEWIPELFRVQGIAPDNYIPLSDDDSLNLKMIKNDHIRAHGYNNALYIADKILYSGDTDENLLLTEYAQGAKIIFHEAMIRKTDVHITLDELATAPAEIKAKTWIVHVPTNERAEMTRMAAEYGFAGVCYNGQEIEI